MPEDLLEEGLTNPRQGLHHRTRIENAVMSSSDPPLEYVESKTPVSDPDHHPQRLHRGALGLVDIATATMAKIGPAMSFYFGFSLIATTAGVASPLTIVAAAIAIALLGNTLAEFSKAHPSTG